ncbi:FMN-binding protein [uncultured Paraglaciecola sp.]|uniref:FMN-binding protein n=1 Tax=uncultured Paraglaciecola sp. TaxID=1765024 RepID=UPI0025E57F05|nr:FMN-binding protein [uncultured Paraglaciecola sp.]
MQRRDFVKCLTLGVVGYTMLSKVAYAKTYLTVDQAQALMLKDVELTPFTVALTKQQAKAIKQASDTRVRNFNMRTWRSANNDWFIVDQVIGKHENIDLAVVINRLGQVTHIEVLTYRETYGDQIMHPKWLAQFYGRDSSEHLKLDKQIRNISGATLSCRHVTDGINRLTHTWKQVLSKL